jgi:hypothetical protein
MNIAIYREVEVLLEHLPNNVVRATLRLPSRTVTFECRSEAIAISKAVGRLHAAHGTMVIPNPSRSPKLIAAGV